MTNLVVNKDIKIKKKKKKKKKLDENQFHNSLRIFIVLPNFSLTTRQRKRDYYLQRWHIRVASRVAERLKT